MFTQAPSSEDLNLQISGCLNLTMLSCIVCATPATDSATLQRLNILQDQKTNNKKNNRPQKTTKKPHQKTQKTPKPHTPTKHNNKKQTS